MILTRSTRLSQPQGPVEVAPEWGGRGAVYLPPVQSNINRVAGTVGRSPTPQGISAIYTAGAETKVERLNGSAPNGVTEFTQIIYLTPTPGGVVNDRGIFGNWNTTGATSLVQLIHRARDATTNGRYCYVVSYDPTSGATAAGIRTSDYSAVDNVPALLIATVKNNTLSLYLNGALHASTAVSATSMSSQAELQIGNYYDITSARRLSANVHMAAFLPRGLGASEVAALSRNPWQLFRPVQRRVYFDMGAGGGAAHTVTADPVEQGSTTTRPGLTQTHVTTASAVAQGETVSRPAITQTHVVTARSVAQGSTVNAPAVEVGGITVVTARPVVQSSTVNAPSIVQTHIVTARPSVQGGTVTRPGQAQGHQAGSTRPGFEMSSRKVYVKRGKRIHIFDTAEDADEWLEAEDKARQVVNVAKPKPKAKAKVFKALDEAVPHDVVRLDVVRSMVDYLGIPVEMPTLEARQDWEEVARVALMARHMQDEEDIELLLVA